MEEWGRGEGAMGAEDICTVNGSEQHEQCMRGRPVSGRCEEDCY